MAIVLKNTPVNDMCQVFVDSLLNHKNDKEICVVSLSDSKDCNLSFCNCHINYNKKYLIRFGPKNPDFDYIKLTVSNWWKLELKALHAKHLYFEIETVKDLNYRQCYVNQLNKLQCKQYGNVLNIVAGDIDYVTKKSCDN